MKRILMLLGTGLNEPELAKAISKHAHVVLVQRTFVERIQTWESGRLLDETPEIPVARFRVAGWHQFDEATFFARHQLLYFRYRKYLRPEPADISFGISYVSTILALLYRLFGRTRKVVCVIVDYMPPTGSLLLRTHRRITGWINRMVGKFSDEVWAISPRILTASANPKNFVMKFPMSDYHAPPAPREEIGYIGFPSPDHGLELLFEVCRKHGFKLNIIGDSPYLQSIRHLAPADAVYHGVTNDSEKIRTVLARCFCGYAVYRKIGPENYSYYGFPSKSLHWFANNTPIVTTDTSYFTEYIVKYGVGRVVKPTVEEVEKAVLDIRARFPSYYEAINHLRDYWNGDMEKFLDERVGALLGESPKI